MGQYAKWIAAAVGTVLSAAIAALTDNVVTDVEWINIAIAGVGYSGSMRPTLGVGSLAVFTAPNVPGSLYTKAILAALMAVLQALVSLISDGITAAEWMQLAVAALTALGVYQVVNTEVVHAPQHYRET